MDEITKLLDIDLPSIVRRMNNLGLDSEAFEITNVIAMCRTVYPKRHYDNRLESSLERSQRRLHSALERSKRYY